MSYLSVVISSNSYTKNKQIMCIRGHKREENASSRAPITAKKCQVERKDKSEDDTTNRTELQASKKAIYAIVCMKSFRHLIFALRKAIHERLFAAKS